MPTTDLPYSLKWGMDNDYGYVAIIANHPTQTYTITYITQPNKIVPQQYIIQWICSWADRNDGYKGKWIWQAVFLRDILYEGNNLWQAISSCENHAIKDNDEN